MPLRFQSLAPFDAPLFESRYFLCVPSLGSLVEGWVLITPKRPLLNMSKLSRLERDDFREFYRTVRDNVESCFGETCAFEHGAASAGSLTGCGVDQAHVHIVPVALRLMVEEVSPNGEWTSGTFALPFELTVPHREYLWLAGADQCFLTYPASPVSQFFRRAVAKVVGRSGQWDYRLHSFEDHIATTQLVLGSATEPFQSRAA